MSSARLLEADKLMESGKKHASKGFFKKPDWAAAAADYQKALNIYINSLSLDKAKEAAKLAAEMQLKDNSFYFAAQALDQMGNTLRDQQREGEAAEFYVDAAKNYARDNKPQQQADCLAKAARCVPVEKTDEALVWMRESIQTLEDSDRWHMIREPYKNLVLLLVRANRFAEAIEAEKKYITAMARADNPDIAAKCGLEIVILSLALGDDVLADREFKELTSNAFGFAHSKQQRTAYDIVAAATSRDPIAFAEALKDQQLTFLLADICRIAKKLKLPSGAPISKPTVAGLNAAEGAGGQKAPPPEDDEENTC